MCQKEKAGMEVDSWRWSMFIQFIKACFVDDSVKQTLEASSQVFVPEVLKKYYIFIIDPIAVPFCSTKQMLISDIIMQFNFLFQWDSRKKLEKITSLLLCFPILISVVSFLYLNENFRDRYH